MCLCKFVVGRLHKFDAFILVLNHFQISVEEQKTLKAEALSIFSIKVIYYYPRSILHRMCKISKRRHNIYANALCPPTRQLHNPSVFNADNPVAPLGNLRIMCNDNHGFSKCIHFP